MPEQPAGRFERDRVTWVAYIVLGWFGFLQAAPGLVMPYLREELALSYGTGGLHVAAFAVGSLAAGLGSGRLGRILRRRSLLWPGAALMSAGVVGLAAGRVAEVTIGSVLVMGFGGGLVLVAIQALLADHHQARRSIALTEANVAASIGYLVVIGALSLAATLDIEWRFALLASLAVPLLAWLRTRSRQTEAGPPPSRAAGGPLPVVVWIAAGVLFCTTAAEWSVIAWGASFVAGAAGVTADAAVALMGGYFGGVLTGRVLGSRLARAHDPVRLLGLALAAAVAGFAILWASTTPEQALLALVLLGVGLGNLYPLGASVAIALAPGQATSASARVVAMSALAGVLAPLTIGPLADATSLSAALLLVPVLLVVAGAGLALVARERR